MYSLLLVDDERLELETLRDYIAWEKLGFDRYIRQEAEGMPMIRYCG